MAKTADHKLIRSINNKLVIDVLRKQAPLSRANLSSLTGLNRSTVSSIISDLIDDGWVKETTYQENQVGRPGLQLELDPRGGYVIGLEIGVDFILAVLVDFAANIIWRKRIETNPDEGQINIQEKAFELTEEAISIVNKNSGEALGIGLALPGLVDVHNGVLKFAPNLKWKNVPLRLIWTQQFHLPVYIENDANAAALGEYFFGAAKDTHNFIYIAAGYGLGSGIIIDGKLLRGNRGYASELGHMTQDVNGEICSCGKRGCFETQIGPRAVINRVKNLIEEKGRESTIIELFNGSGSATTIDYDDIVDAARKNDQIALDSLHYVGNNLGLAVSNLINIFNPKMVILGGALNYAADFIKPSVEEMVKMHALSYCQEDLIITISELGQEASVMGGIALVFEGLYTQ